MRVPSTNCNWWNLTVASGSALMMRVRSSSSVSLSSGRPRMKCAPTATLRAAVASTARRAAAKSWPRSIVRSVASEVDSMPYSTQT